MISVIMINSRGDKHPDWLQTAVDSIKKQTVEVELIIEDNIGRGRSVGACWNAAVKKAKYDLVLFFADDDWLSMDYCSVLLQYALMYPDYTQWTTNMIAFDEKTKLYTVLTRICTGMWKREYLLKYPFNEKLKRGIDREYIQEMQKRGDRGFTINHHYGYYYRKHEDYSLAGMMTFTKKKADIYVLTSSRNFIDPLVNKWRKDKEVFVSTEQFNPLMADDAEIIWCEWLREDAIAASKYECKATKILRVHSYEAFSPLIYYVDFNKFDKVIFIAEHIKDFVESKVGKIENAVVIPVGVHLNGFNPKRKKVNNKIAYAGEISRKKGIGELLFIAKNLPDYEFHVAGKFTEEDVARHLNEKQPDNVFIHPYCYDLPKFFEDKTYIINTSLREGNPITVLEAMACGLKPLIYDWVGAEDIYGEYVFKDIESLKKLLDGYNPTMYRNIVEENFNVEKMFNKIQTLIKEEK